MGNILETRPLWCKPICFYVTDVYLEFEKRRDAHALQKPREINIAELKEPDVYQAEEPMPSTFASCFSDSESEDEDW